MIKTIANSVTLKEILTDKGLKPTYQRILILDYFYSNAKKHLTAERIYETLSKKTSTLSLTTVYNTLGSFLEAGLVSAITITGTEVRYELATTPHHHLLCKQCGRIIDIDIQCPNVKRKSIKGYKIEEVHGYFKGICKRCLKKQPKQ
jgi:Fur family peroxide stress response transcriptional regulator